MIFLKKCSVFAWMDLTQKNIEDISNLTRLREMLVIILNNINYANI